MGVRQVKQKQYTVRKKVRKPNEIGGDDRENETINPSFEKREKKTRENGNKGEGAMEK